MAAGQGPVRPATSAVDDLIASTGVAYRPLANPSFIDNTIRSPIAGDRTLPAVATRDIVAAARACSSTRAGAASGEVPLLGPEDLSFNDMARIMSEVLGMQVRFQQNTFEAYKDRLVSSGMSGAMAQGMTDMARAKNQRIDNAVPRTPQNSTPTSVRQWTEQVLKPAAAA
jgi:uncharacterized protein YbjT (DUF2867 family)